MASPRLTARLRSLQQRDAEFRSENGCAAETKSKSDYKDYNSELKSRTRDPDLYRDYISRRAAEREKEKEKITNEPKISSLSTESYKSDYHKDYSTTTTTTNKDYTTSTSLKDYTTSVTKDHIINNKDSNIKESIKSSPTENSVQKDYSVSREKTSCTVDSASTGKQSNSISADSSTPSDKDSHKHTTNGTSTTASKDYSNLCKEDKSNGLDGLSHLLTSKEMKNSEEDDEFVGFATLPDQVHRKAVKRGFDFTLMVVGESGLGKSTLINSLFLTDLYTDRKLPSVADNIDQTIKIDKKYMEFEERGVKLRLTIVDTPGFNDAVNAEECWKPVEDYVVNQFEQYYEDECGVNRKHIQDNRVHCCLYFISPYGHGLRQVDIEYMKKLHEKVNIVPVIAKSDTLLPREMKKLKERVLEEIEENKIKIYEFPDCDSDEDDEFKTQDSELKAAIPFAVIGSNVVVEVHGRRVRGRLYPWGIVEVDNPQHCDFTKLRQMLISTHMQDLKDVTRDIHYENFRARRVAEQMTKQQIKERNKLKRDSSPNFETIMDTDKLLEQKDEEIRRMQEMLLKMQQQLGGKAQMNGRVNVAAS